MKKIASVLLTIITLTNAFGQTDKHGNPVFNSETISEEKFDNFELTSNYYNIKDNISNKQSSVYVNDKPGIPDYLKFSRDLPSYFFIVHKGADIVVMMMLVQKNSGEKTTLTYNILNPRTGKSMEAPCKVWGEIAEKRVDELEKIKPDPYANTLTLNDGRLYMFNNIGYRIQPYDKLKAEVIEIATQLVGGDGKEEIKDPIEYIKKETIGGELDFNKALEKETRTLFLNDGVAYNKKDFAIYLWGKKVKSLGIESSKKASKLLEEINNRALTDPEKKALANGFESKTE